MTRLIKGRKKMKQSMARELVVLIEFAVEAETHRPLCWRSRLSILCGDRRFLRFVWESAKCPVSSGAIRFVWRTGTYGWMNASGALTERARMDVGIFDCDPIFVFDYGLLFWRRSACLRHWAGDGDDPVFMALSNHLSSNIEPYAPLAFALR
jgi:hypothetical protein